MKRPAWICADGAAVSLSAMSEYHIVNAWTYLRTGTGPHGDMLRTWC